MSKRIFLNVWTALLSLVAALTLGGLILLYMGESPAQIYLFLLSGALGNAEQISTTLLATTPYLLAGLSLAVAFKANLFNIGAEGQIFAGAMAAAIVGRYLSIVWISPFFLILVAVLSGMLWAWIPAKLKNFFGIHEVISTIMLNYVMFSLCAYLLRHPAFRAAHSAPRTADIAVAAQLPMLSLAGLKVDIGLLLGVLLAIFLVHFFRRMTLGFEIRVTGLNPKVAQTAGIDERKISMLAFLLSGGIAGLVGGLFVASPLHPFFELGFSPGWGFWGIALALLARNHPIGVIFGALLFGIFETGGGYLDTSLGIPRELVQILEALIILFVSSGLFARMFEEEEVAEDVR